MQLHNLTRRHDNVRRSRAYFERRCVILEHILKLECPHLNIPKGPVAQEGFYSTYIKEKSSAHEVAAPQENFVQLLLHESQVNALRQPSGRRWSMAVVKFCFLLRTLGAKSYDCLRTFLTLPAKMTFSRYFEPAFMTWKKCLIAPAMICGICQLFRRLHNLRDTDIIDVAVGIDAMAMEPVTADAEGAKKGSNNVFLFQMMPLQCEFRSIPLHLMTKNQGNAGADVLDRLKLLKSLLKDLKFNTRFVAVDGDSGYFSLHEEMFGKWWPFYCSRGLDAVLQGLNTDGLIVADPLHIAKNARSRLITGPLTMCCDGSHPFTSDMMNEILNLGPALSDHSMHGKMRDIYALQIYNLDNFDTLVRRKRLVMAFYILPYALWMEAVRNPGLSVQMRRDFINIAFEIFVYHMKNINHLDKTAVSQNRKDSLIQYCCSEVQCVRILNTLLVTLVELTKHPDNLALSRIGTHGLECQFGIVRVMCRNKHTWKMILRSFSRLMIVKEFTKAFSYFPVRDRVNVAGVKVHASSTFQNIYILMPNIDIRNLYEWIHMREINQDRDTDDSLAELLDEINNGLETFTGYIASLIRQCAERNVKAGHLWMGSPVSNNGILARLISFRACEDDVNDTNDESVIDHADAEVLVNAMTPDIPVSDDV